MTGWTGKRVRLVVRAGIAPARVRALTRWLRAFVPAAVLVLTPAGAMVDDDGPDTVTLDADAIPSGPLSLADLLARAARR